jgi:hypothetical protein
MSKCIFQITLSKIRPIAWRHLSDDRKSCGNVRYKYLSFTDEDESSEEDDFNVGNSKKTIPVKSISLIFVFKGD